MVEMQNIEMNENVETSQNSTNTCEKTAINRLDNQKKKSKWYVLPPTIPISENEQTINNINDSSQLKSTHKYFYTLIIFFTIHCVGIIDAGLSPALVDLGIIFHTNIEHVSNYFTCHSIGMIVGNSLGYLFKNKFLNRQITLTVTTTLSGISFALIPHSPNLFIFYVLALLCGIHVGVGICVCSVWLMEIWQEKCHPILHVLKFLYAIGTIIGPAICSGFVVGIDGEIQEIKKAGTNATSTQINTDANKSISNRKLSIIWPFLAMGSITLLSGMFHWVMLSVKKYHYQEKQESSPKIEIKLLNNPDAPYKLVFSIAIILFASFGFTQNGYLQFSPTFSQFISLRLSASQAAHVFSFFTASFAIGRLISIYCAIKLNITIMLIGNLILTILANIVLLGSIYSYTLLVIGNILLGLGLCSFVATFIAFLGTYLVYNDRVSTTIQLFAGVSRIFIPIIIGGIIESSPISLIYLNLSTIIITTVCFALIVMIIRIYHKSRININDVV